MKSLRNAIGKKIVAWLSHERERHKAPLCDFEKIRYEIRPCDVLLIEGRSRVSEVIQRITQSPWSHAALYLGRIHDIEDPVLRQRVTEFYTGNEDEQLIIEGMLGKGTIVSSLNNYMNDHIRICRPQGISRHDAQQVLAYSIGQLGLEYHVRQVFDLMRFLFPWGIMPRRWRSSLFEHNVGEQTHTICSTLIGEAFWSVQFPILPLIRHNGEKGTEYIPRHPKLFTPKDFDYSPYFDIIKYPIFQFGERARYRYLPWTEVGLTSDSSGNIIEPATTNDEISVKDQPKNNPSSDS
ncbi:MAG: hypothetical protein CMF50_09365 [Legionellales bacterium]|nr:hypothetical protein [Legionellales bacterium]